MSEPLDLDELERLLAAGTPRPWFCDKTSEVYTWDGDDLIRLADMSEGHGWKPEVNGTFIVAAVNALPALIARVRGLDVLDALKDDALETAVERLRDEVERRKVAEARVAELVTQRDFLLGHRETMTVERDQAQERIAALEAAARSVLPHLWLTAHTEALTPDIDLCMGCGGERRTGHDTGCPVWAFTALLEEGT